jgi:hypothetical protein
MFIPSLAETIRSIVAALRLARFDARGFGLLTADAEGAWRSFFAAVLALPIYVVRLWLDFAQTTPQPDPWRYGFVAGIAYVISWTAFPVVMERLTQLLQCRDRYFAYLTAYNWSLVVQYALWLPVMLAGDLGLLPDSAAQLLLLATFGFVLAYAWFIARHGLALTPLNAVAVVSADLILSYLISSIALDLQM